MKHISALFINPPALEVKEPRYDTPDIPNISIAYIGAALRNYKGVCQVSLLDAKLERLTIDQTAERIRNARADIVGFTGLTNDIEQVRLLMKKAKADCPASIFVLGGVHATVLPEETMTDNPELDYVIINEGEIAIQKLVDAHFLKEFPLEEVPNLYYRENGCVKKTREADWIYNLDSVAFPAWDLFPPVFKSVPIMTARGCPFACRFCHPLGTKHRERSPDNVLAEIHDILKYKPEIIWFYDETFGIHKPRIFEILRRLKEIPDLPRMSCTLRINTTTAELLDKIAEAGFKQVGFGIESASERVLKDKLLDVDKAYALMRHARKSGLAIEAYFIFGHPDETKSEIWQTIKLAGKLNPTIPIFGIMTPYPGTEIYELAKKRQGGYRLIAKSWNDYNKHLGVSVEFTNIGNFNMEMLRLFGYIYFFTVTLRFKDLLKFFYDYRVYMLSALEKLPERLAVQVRQWMRALRKA